MASTTGICELLGDGTYAAEYNPLASYHFKSCGNDWVYNSELKSYYYVAPKTYSQQDGRQFCSALHPSADLVDILSEEEQKFVADLYTKIGISKSLKIDSKMIVTYKHN